MACISKPLRDGKKYHYSVLYNYYEGTGKRQGDHLLSWKFLKAMEGKLSGIGYDQVMYHDIARTGSNIFDNLLSMVNESEKIVVLLTPEFLSRGWHKYTGQVTVKNLLDRNEANTRFIPIAINVDVIPENLGLSNTTIIYTRYDNYTADERVWDAILKAMGPNEVHHEHTSSAMDIGKTSDDKEVKYNTDLEENIPRDNSTKDIHPVQMEEESSKINSKQLVNPTNLSHGPPEKMEDNAFCITKRPRSEVQATSEPRTEGTSAITNQPRSDGASASGKAEGDKGCQSNTSSKSATADGQPQSRDCCCWFQ